MRVPIGYFTIDLSFLMFFLDACIEPNGNECFFPNGMTKGKTFVLLFSNKKARQIQPLFKKFYFLKIPMNVTNGHSVFWDSNGRKEKKETIMKLIIWILR